jgi:biopolymer transport protein ExbD
VERDRLQELLTQVYANRASDKILYFKADQNLEYAKVEGAIEVARKSGVRVMAAITEEKRGQQRGLFGRQ